MKYQSFKSVVNGMLCDILYSVVKVAYPLFECKNFRVSNFSIERVFYRGFLSNICTDSVFQKASFLHRVILYKAIYGAT